MQGQFQPQGRPGVAEQWRECLARRGYLHEHVQERAKRQAGTWRESFSGIDASKSDRAENLS